MFQNMFSSISKSIKPMSLQKTITIAAMNNKTSSTCACIIPFPKLDDVVTSGWEDLRKLILRDEPRLKDKDLDEKVEVVEIKEELANEGDDDTTPDEYPPNPYQFNICGSIPIFPLGPPNNEWVKEPSSQEEIKENIKDL